MNGNPELPSEEVLATASSVEALSGAKGSTDNSEPVASMEDDVTQEPSEFSDCDVISYYGLIDKAGYINLSKLIEKKILADEKSKDVILILVTPGGDPDAGFRIGRALNHHYEKVTILIPDVCKSAGTLIAVAANELIIGDLGELGPLDIQLRKTDEIGELTSTLDIFKSITELQNRTLDCFRDYVTDIKYGSGIGTKLASEIASNLTKAVISPISAQIDPIKIGEHHRALQIAKHYARLLNERANNLHPNALKILVEGYPCHSFVIDRCEARKIFKQVKGTVTPETEALYRLARHYLNKKFETAPFYLTEYSDVQDFTKVALSLSRDLCGTQSDLEVEPENSTKEDTVSNN
ncbi:SDH family Clp fold serine proteinase [Aeromonas veronii]|uniref:SDH family Clp fold serine proteinase n=1 Tax=Aeromonas veronii TaxID=654 RepID=UPI003A31876A